MGIDTVLKKEGIEKIKPLDTLDVNRIAKNISHKLVSRFGDYNLNESELFISISRLNMYFAKMPEDLAGAKYSYINNSIYFNDQFDLDEIEESAIHECIHYLQEVKDEKGKLSKMGLCNFQTEGEKGLALNEAAVQLMAAEALNREADRVKYFEIFLVTKSPDYYPLECVLLSEMMYFTGEYPLYHSTLYSDDVFKNDFCGRYGKKTYRIIKDGIYNILRLESELNNQMVYLQHIDNPKKAKQLNQAIELKKKKITNMFLEIQDCIMNNCFNVEMNMAKSVEELQAFKDKLYRFKDIIGFTAEYKNFNDFYIRKMKEFEQKKEYIEKYGTLVDKGTGKVCLELVDTQTKSYSFFKRLLIKLGILSEINKGEMAYNRNKNK